MAQGPAAASLRRLWRLVLVPLPFLVSLPFLSNPSFSLIDDGVNLDTARRMDAHETFGKPGGPGGEHSSWWLVETAQGRVRPVYWWWQWLNYRLFGFNCRAWHWALAAAIALVLQAAYAISYRVTGSVLASVLAGGLIAAFYPCAEAFWRLGLGETPMLLLLGLSVLCLTKGYALGPQVPRAKRALFWVCFGGAIVPMCLAYFVKETSVAMLPVSVVVLAALWRRGADAPSKALLIGYAGANAVAAAALAAYVLPTLSSGMYSRLYLYDQLGWAVRHAGQYAWYVGQAWLVLPVVALVSFVVRLVRSRRGEGISGPLRWEFVWLAFMVAYVAVLAPWGGSDVAIARYLWPFALFGGLFVGQETAWLLEHARQAAVGPAESGRKRKKRAKAARAAGPRPAAAVAGLVLLIGALAAVAGVNAGLGRKAILRSHEVEAANGNLLRLLAAEAPRDRPLYVNLSADEEEIRYEIGLHLAMIYGRDDFSNSRSVRFLGDPAQGAEAASLPAPGDWVIAPEGNYRYGMKLPKAVWLAQWARVFIVDAAGRRAFEGEEEDAARLAVAFKALRCGWVVIVAGPKAPMLTPMPEIRPGMTVSSALERANGGHGRETWAEMRVSVDDPDFQLFHDLRRQRKP